MSLLPITILYLIIKHYKLANTACFGSSSIIPPKSNSSQIMLIMNTHQLQYIDSYTLDAWSLDLDLVNETYAPIWKHFNITNTNNISLHDNSIIQSQRYTTINDTTYIIQPKSTSLILYNATSHNLYNPLTHKHTDHTLYKYTDLSAFCITNNNTHLFLMGGMITTPASAIFYSELLIYDVYNSKWLIGVNMTSTRVGHGCNYDGNNYIYVYGGYKDIFDYAYFIERYNIINNSWEQFMDYTNVIGTDVYRAFSRQCITMTKYPLHTTTCVEYPNIKDNEFNGEISLVNHKEKLAMNTIYKMNNFLGMILYDVDRFANNYSFLLLFGSDQMENAMYSLIDRQDGGMDCYFPGKEPKRKIKDDHFEWIFFSAAVLLFIVFFVILIIWGLCRGFKRKDAFQKVEINDTDDKIEKRSFCCCC
eukprot:162315_1